MSDISHLTIIQQVRRNLLTELVEGSAKDERLQHELYEFLTYEPVEVNSDVYKRIGNLSGSTVALARIAHPFFQTENPKPILEAYTIKGIWRYFLGWGLFFVTKMLLRVLPRILIMRESLQAVNIASLDSIPKRPLPPLEKDVEETKK